MRLFKFFVLFVAGICFFSCEKKKLYPEPVTVENSAVYYSSLTIDNSPIEMQAGVNGYYMYASYALDSSYVYRFTGDLRKENCTDCNNSLKIEITDYKVSAPNTAPVIENSLRNQTYAFLSGDPEPAYVVKFNALPDSTMSYLWNFGDGTSSQLASPSKTFSQAGVYNVCLTTTSKNNYVNTICNQEKINVSDKSCKTSIRVSASSGNSISFTNVTTGGKKPYSYFWDFGDGATSTDSDPTRNYQFRGAKMVSLRVTDSNGDTAVANYNAKTATDNSSFLANYFIGSIVDQAAPPALSKVIVTWTDANGVAYTSNQSLQPSNSSFEILSVEANDKNEKGEPTKKITAKFQCKLFNGSKSITVNDAKIVICVAYK